MAKTESRERIAALVVYALFRTAERRSHRALRRAELWTRRELDLSVRDVTSRVRGSDDDERAALAEIRKIVPLLAVAVEAALRRARAHAREEGRRSLSIVAPGGRPLDSRSAHDAVRAHTTAASYAAAWGAQATARVLGEEGATSALAQAPDPRLVRIAATETASAFNDERRRIAREAPLPHDTFRIWSALLDRATCPFCFTMDGETRGRGEAFRVSPPVHPNCRCTLELVVLAHPERLDDVAFDYALFKQEVRDVIRERREVPGRHAVRFVTESTKGPRRSPVVLTEAFRRGDYRQR